MPPENLITYACPAKVNLALSVAAPTTPGGLHPIASWMVAFDYSDTLTIQMIDDGPSRFDLAFEPQIQESTELDWPIETDLTFRAHALLEKYTGRSLPVYLKLRKRIPTGAGLGGGSSDAAFTLVGLNELFQLGIGDQQLKSLASELGSDVAFLVGVALGDPSAIVTGTGEAIEPAPLPQPIFLTLIFPQIACPTGKVYGSFDRLAGTTTTSTTPDSARVRALVKQLEISVDDPFNDLAEAALAVKPDLRQILETIQQVIGVTVHVTGSGSTLFVVGRTHPESQNIAQTIQTKIGVRAAAVRSIQAAVR